MPLLPALPTSYRSAPVIPYAPNARADREHEWDWTNETDTNPAGLTIITTRETEGRESFTLKYVGLNRAEARTLESFVDDRAGRREGFWCPTFQQDYYAADFLAGGLPGGALAIREWGYGEDLTPLAWARHFAAYRAGTVGGSWYMAILATQPNTAPYIATAPDGTLLRGYNITGVDAAGNASVVSSNTHSTGLRLTRLLWVRLADDRVTTEWAHPNHAAITLHVTAVPSESP